MTAGEIRTDNTKTLMNALERIAVLERENAELRNKLDGNKQNMAHALGDIRVTDEEMARQYLIEKYGLRKDLEFERIQHSVLSIEYYTYLAGLKAGEKLGLRKA